MIVANTGVTADKFTSEYINVCNEPEGQVLQKED